MTFELGIPSILEALLRVSPDLLRAHRMDVISALETIAERVGVTVIRNSSCAPSQQVHTTTPFRRSSHTPVNNELLQKTAGTSETYEDRSFQHYTTPSPTSRDENSCPEDATQLTTDDVLSETYSSNSNSPPSFRSQRFLQKVQEKLNNISQFSKNSSQNIVKGFFEHLRSEDSRLGHIKSITGKHNPKPGERFIQCLAQRSLALDFYQWENSVQGAGNTRLDDVSSILSSVNNKNGNFKLYVERVARFNDTESAYQALRRGTKQLVVEKMCQTSGMGVAIPFAYGSFDALTYKDIYDFSSLLKDQLNILHTLQNASSWVEAGQSAYNEHWQNERRWPPSSSYAAKRRRLVSQPRVFRAIRPRSSGGTAARELNGMQNNSSAPYVPPLERNLRQDQTEDSPNSSQPPSWITSTSARHDDAQSLPKGHISTNDPAQHTSVNQSVLPTSSISESVDISPYYSGRGGSGAPECHNDSVSKQVRNGREPSRIRELPFDERDAARMLQQFQQRMPRLQPQRDPVPRCSSEQGGTSVTEPINNNPDSCVDLAPIVNENHERQFPCIASGRISGEPINSRNRIPQGQSLHASPTPESQSSVEPWASVLFDQSMFHDLGTQHPISEQPTVEPWPSVLFDQSMFHDLGTQHPISGQSTVEQSPRSVGYDNHSLVLPDTSPADGMNFRQSQLFPTSDSSNT
ncbi:hypothetical protein RJZ56_001507 [Blastomyces dermatitidis]